MYHLLEYLISLDIQDCMQSWNNIKHNGLEHHEVCRPSLQHNYHKYIQHIKHLIKIMTNLQSL